MFIHRHTALFLTAMISGLPCSAFAGPQNVPTDSFIARHVSTVSELHQQISLDPVVRRRLARHFHTSAPAVTRYIQNNLVLKKLSKAGTYKVYCISRTGREYTISQHLAAGTPVFVMRSTGQPVLKLACGNPMMAALPPVMTKVAAYRSPEIAAASAPAVSDGAAPAIASTGPVVVAMNDAPAVAVMPTTRVAGFIGQLPVVHGGGIPLGFLAAIPVLATVVGSHHGGGGSTPSVGTGTTGTGTTGTGTTGTGTTGTTGTGTGTTDTGTGTTGTGTTGTGTTDTGTGATGTTGTGTGTTGNTGTTGTETGTTGTATGTTGTDTLGTNTGGTDTNGNNTNGNNTGGTTATTGTGTAGIGTGGTNTLGTNTGTTVSPVPEPSTPAVFAVGGMFLLFLVSGAKRRSRSKTR